MAKKAISLWNDVRESVNEYSPEELLAYYRVAQWIAQNQTNDNLSNIASNICETVDMVLHVIRCQPDYRAIKYYDVLTIEYCSEQATSSEKISQADVSRSTYYTYLKLGNEMFAEIFNSYRALSNSEEGVAESD